MPLPVLPRRGYQASALVALAFILSPLASHAQPRTIPTTISEQYLFAAANQARSEHGLSPLRYDPLLAQAALRHAQEMANHHSISHQFSGEPDLAARAGKAGVRFSLITENVAEAPNSALIHELWMQSAGHRANLLDPKVDSLGVAVVVLHGELYAVQDFAHIVQRISLADQEARVADIVVAAGVDILTDPADARQTCQLSSGYTGRHQPWFVMRYTASDLSRLPDELATRLSSGRFHSAAIGACAPSPQTPFASYSIAVLLYP
jgi:uncharacterized protein YkwD